VSFTINTNIAAMTAMLNLDNTSDQLNQSIQRLSSGLRINSAADDPAGLIISQNMGAQLQGLNQAVQNSQDAINMANTAEGALQEVSTLLNNIRSLAVYSANTAVVDGNVLQANQSEIQSTIQSINRIADQTQFGTKKLLNGTAGVLANVTDPTDVSSIYMGGTFGGQSIANGPVTLTQVTQGVDAQVTLGQSFASPSATVTTPGTFVINGYSFVSDGSTSLQTIVNNINQMSGTTGVSASITGSAGAYSVTLTQNTLGSKYGISYFDPSNVLDTNTSEQVSGVDAVYNVQATTTNGVQTVTFTGGRGPDDSGLTLSDTEGNRIVLTDAGNQNITNATQVGVITAGAMQFQIGAFSGQSVQFSLPAIYADMLGTDAVPGQSIATLDVTTQTGAQNAMKIIDDAITQVSQLRGNIGSFQKDFLQSTVRSLGVAQQNLTASQSTIQDADMAQEITTYTKEQILQQSGMAVLAQANQQPQNVLQLLKNLP